MKRIRFAHNWSLITAILLPIVMMGAVFLSVSVPNLFIKPQFDFLYSLTNDSVDSSNQDTYSVRDGRLNKTYTNDDNYYGYTSADASPQYPNLYRYDVHTNTSERISYSQATEFELTSASTSPDGFKLKQASEQSNGIWFVGSFSNDGSWYIQKGWASHKLNLGNDTNNDTFTFIGWIQ